MGITGGYHQPARLSSAVEQSPTSLRLCFCTPKYLNVDITTPRSRGPILPIVASLQHCQAGPGDLYPSTWNIPPAMASQQVLQ